MSKAAAVTSISSTGKAVVNFPASEELSGKESAKINLTLSLGGLYEENAKVKPMGREIDPMKCISLKRLPAFPPEAKKMLAGSWDVGSSSMDQIRSNGSQNNSSLLIKKKNEAETSLTIIQNPLKKIKVVKNVITDVTALKMMNIMPSVTTIGDKPNGRKIEGFLYSYNNKKNIKIVCVCHGKMMSPLEFIYHAGVIELKNPFKYITVLPPTL